MILATLQNQLLTLGLLALWSLTAVGVGRLAMAPWRLSGVSRGEEVFYAGGLGLLLMGYGLFLLGAVDALSAFPLSLFGGLSILAALTGWFRPLPAPSLLPQPRPAVERAAGVLLAGILLLAFPLVLTPETGKDALIYHLAVPKRYLEQGGFHFIPGNVFAGYPLLGEMHYLLALFLQGDILAKAMHFTLLPLTLLGIGLLGRQGDDRNAFPRLAMAVFASIPSVFAVAHTAYNDLFVTLFSLAALLALLRWSVQPQCGWIALAGLFSGAAMACKYTALLLIPLGLLALFYLYHERHPAGRSHDAWPAIRLAAIFLAAACLSGSPFYVKNWITLGNPVYPFFHEWFGGRGWDTDQARLYTLFIRDLGMGRDWLDYLLLPWNVSLRAEMDSPRFDGILGPVFLFTFPFLVGRHRWGTAMRVMLGLLLFSFLFWASAAQQIRYLIPQFAPAAVVLGILLTRSRNHTPLFALLLVLIGLSLVFNVWHLTRQVADVRPLAASIGLESRGDFLSRRIPVYGMYRIMNERLPGESRVLLIYMKNFTFLCERACYADALFETHTLQRLLRTSGTSEAVRKALADQGFTHLLYDETFLMGDPSPLSQTEKARFMSFRARYLEGMTSQGPYRLERLLPPPGNLPLIH